MTSDWEAMDQDESLLSYPTEESRARMWQAVATRIKTDPRRWPRTLGVLGLVIATAAVGVPAMAGASGDNRTAYEPAGLAEFPGAETYTHDDLLDIGHQQYLSHVLDPLSELDGYADGGYENETDAIRVLWRGELSTQARRIIADGQALGIETEVVYVTHTPDQLLELGGTLALALREAGFDVWTVEPADNYSALRVSGSNLALDDQAHVSEIAREAIGNLPVRIVGFEPEIPVEF